MIVVKEWKKIHRRAGGMTTETYSYHGWFLFGFIPLYIHRYGCY